MKLIVPDKFYILQDGCYNRMTNTKNTRIGMTITLYGRERWYPVTERNFYRYNEHIPKDLLSHQQEAS
ncbi:MAG: hypothetical protein PHT07_19445 [Paludibacter sp.]|nr:hypothetical protein [Paludibacter sp.]